MTTIGKYRHLLQNSTPGGHFVILAIDHRGNLRSALDRSAPQPITDQAFSAFKQQVIQHLVPRCSAVLVDPAYGLGPGIASGIVPGSVGLLSPLELTNYDVTPDQREPALIPGWSVGQIKRMGGTGVKMLLFYHPEDRRAPARRDVVARVVDECAACDLPFFLEPLVYSPDPARPLPSAEKRRLVIETARTFSQMGIDVLKTEFPLDVKQDPDEAMWRSALEELNAACRVPWALLSAGVDYAVFERQVALACECGASGVIVGRAVWAEAVTLQGDAREEFLRTTGRARMDRLASLCAQATPWRERVSPPDVPLDWYERYPGLASVSP